MADRLLHLLRAAVKRDRTTLTSGKTSDRYIDCCKVTLTPEGSVLVAKKLMWTIMLDVPIAAPRPTAVIGPLVSACPLVTGIGFQAEGIGWLDLKLGYVRKTPKDHGTGKPIEGCDITTADRVTIVDDVATSGGSLLRCVEAVRRAARQATIIECLVLVDREEGAAQALFVKGVKLRSIYTRDDLL